MTKMTKSARERVNPLTRKPCSLWQAEVRTAAVAVQTALVGLLLLRQTPPVFNPLPMVLFQAEVRTAAVAVQTALVGLLADANESTQELASKGLSALFDCCDPESRKLILDQVNYIGIYTS